MTLELDHVFILVDPGAAVRSRIVAEGFAEGIGRSHPGQGTSNCTFPFGNGFLELLWVHDAREARDGPGKGLRFVARTADPAASPFGVILRPGDSGDSEMPFDGWTYQPDYFEPPDGFHVGANSERLDEPLCIYAPFLQPPPARPGARSITEVLIATASYDDFGVLDIANRAERLTIVLSEEHRMELTLDGNESGRHKDFRPQLPLILRW